MLCPLGYVVAFRSARTPTEKERHSVHAGRCSFFVVDFLSMDGGPINRLAYNVQYRLTCRASILPSDLSFYRGSSLAELFITTFIWFDFTSHPFPDVLRAQTKQNKIKLKKERESMYYK